MKLLTPKVIAIATLAMFATALAPFLGDDYKNYLVIAFAAAMPFMALAARLPPTVDIAWAAAAIVYSFVVMLWAGDTENLKTVVYTALFAIAYLGFAATLRTGRVSRELVEVTLRRLLYAYAATFILQFVASRVGLPVPNQILTKDGISFNGLAVEPSHAGRFLAITFLAYVFIASGGRSLGLKELFRHHLKPVAVFLVGTWLTGSALAILALAVGLLLTLRLRWLVAGVLAFVAVWPALSHLNFDSVQRVVAFLTALPDMDTASLAGADHSASLRVAPMLIYLEKLSTSDIHFWLGDGLAAIGPYMIGELTGTDVVGVGFWPGYVIAFGVVGTALFLIAFVLRFTTASTAPIVALWVILFTTSAWNVQFFWYGLMMIRVAYHWRRVSRASRPVMSPTTFTARAHRRHA